MQLLKKKFLFFLFGHFARGKLGGRLKGNAGL